MKRLLASLALLAAATGTGAHANSTVNVNITSQTDDVTAFIAVTLLGAGGGVASFTDLATAPTTEADALALALSILGLPASTLLSGLTDTATGTQSIFEETVTANYYPDPGYANNGYVIGDPDNYNTWIATGPEDINVDVLQTTTTYHTYSLSANIVPPVPLPASGVMLLGLMAGAAGVACRRTAASHDRASPIS